MQAATAPAETRGEKRYVAARRVPLREAEGWKKVLVNGEPVTQESGSGQKSFLMVPV